MRIEISGTQRCVPDLPNAKQTSRGVWKDNPYAENRVGNRPTKRNDVFDIRGHKKCGGQMDGCYLTPETSQPKRNLRPLTVGVTKLGGISKLIKLEEATLVDTGNQAGRNLLSRLVDSQKRHKKPTIQKLNDPIDHQWWSWEWYQ
jgi:hypothetical protein